MEDPIKRHPTRTEQLDILASLVAEHVKDGESALDLGFGVGYVGIFFPAKSRNLPFAGVDGRPNLWMKRAQNLLAPTSPVSKAILNHSPMSPCRPIRSKRYTVF